MSLIKDALKELGPDEYNTRSIEDIIALALWFCFAPGDVRVGPREGQALKLWSKGRPLLRQKLIRDHEEALRRRMKDMMQDERGDEDPASSLALKIWRWTLVISALGHPAA